MLSDDEVESKNMVEDDNEIVNPHAHKNLLKAISSLGKVQHIKRTTRNECEKLPGEFQLVKNAFEYAEQRSVPSHPVGINDIVQVLKGTSKHVKVGRNLKNVTKTTKVVPVPLEKPAAERIKRTIGYENVKTKLARWDAVVAKNRSTETQVFPLAAETVYIDTSAHAKPYQLAVKSDLVREMEETEAKLAALRQQRYGDNIDPKDQEASNMLQLQKKLTRDELIARSKELSYLKMRESQKSAKARMQNKIKSKKYHKLMKRHKMQEQIKEFELLQKTNPEAALEKLSMLEKNRVLERANLRHKNTGTWAKNLQVRAKYNKDVRKDLAEQLQISRNLTQKKHESDEEEDAELKNSNDSMEQEALNNDPFNPWIRTQKNTAKEKLNNEEQSYRKYWEERNKNKKLLEEFNTEIEVNTHTDEEDTVIDIEPLVKEARKSASAKLNSKNIKSKKVKLENGWIVEDIEVEKSKVSSIDIDDIFDAEEDRQVNSLNKKLKILAKESKRLSKSKAGKTGNKQRTNKKPKDELKQLSDLTFKETAKRPIVDEELNGDNDDSVDNQKRLNEIASKASASNLRDSSAKTASLSDVIDPNQIAPIKLKQSISFMNPLEAAEYDDEVADSNEHNLTTQQLTISQAFVDDDIIADFTKDKSEKSKIADDEIVLSMPGWGSWAGAGISKDLTNKNKRLVLKLAPEEKRRDENKSGTYINEEASKSLRKHLVSDVPFPFTSLQDYEASIRAPIGRNFITETSFRNLTRPAVIVRKGQVIEPMDESELVKRNKKAKGVVQKRIQRAGL